MKKFNLKKHWWIVALAAIGLVLILMGQGFMGALIEGYTPSPIATKIATINYNGVTGTATGNYVDFTGVFGAIMTYETVKWGNSAIVIVGAIPQRTDEATTRIRNMFSTGCALNDADLVAALKDKWPEYDYSVHYACDVRYVYATSAINTRFPEIWAGCAGNSVVVLTNDKGLVTQLISLA